MPELNQQREYYERVESETGMDRALSKEEEMARLTARSRLSVLRKYVEPKRLLDVGCTTGVFLDDA